jgi:hypothetical protein
MADSAHTKEATKEVAQSIRDFLAQDEEGELDPYDKVGTTANAAHFKVTNMEDDLLYLVTVTPVED